MHQAPKPYYLYDRGYNRVALNLGTLLLGTKTFADPSSGRYCTKELLEDPERKRYATETAESLQHDRAQGFEVNVKIKVLSADEPAVDFSMGRCHNLRIEAESGRRVEILDVPAFFRDRVMSSPDMRQQLENWLTVTTSIERMSRMMNIAPTIWLLTGFIELDNARCSTSTSRSGSAGLSVPSELIVAATGAPIGGGIHGKGSQETSTQRRNPDTLIWAARYEKLKVHYLKDNEELDQATVQVKKIPVFSSGMLRGHDSKHNATKEEAVYLHLVLDDGQDLSEIPRSLADNTLQDYGDGIESAGDTTQNGTDAGCASSDEQEWWEFFDLTADEQRKRVSGDE